MIKQYMPGDILFYTSGSGSDIADTAIRLVTDSDIVHVAIAVSALIKVEALLNGVFKSVIDYRTVAYSYYLHEKATPLNTENISSALLWLDSQVGQMYGYGDIVNALLSKFESAVTINILDHYDCSGLASEFLKRCTGTKISDIANTHNVTPVQLAKILNVS